MAVSSTVIAQAVGHGVALLVGYVASRQGAHLDATQSAEVAAVASMIVGPIAGHLVATKPGKEAESVIDDVEKLLTVVSESGSNPRSALHVTQPAVQDQGK